MSAPSSTIQLIMSAFEETKISQGSKIMYFTNLAKLLIKIRIINSQTLHLPKKKKHTHTKYFHLYILKYAASFFGLPPFSFVYHEIEA